MISFAYGDTIAYFRSLQLTTMDPSFVPKNFAVIEITKKQFIKDVIRAFYYQILRNYTTNLKDINYIYNITGVFLPISKGNIRFRPGDGVLISHRGRFYVAYAKELVKKGKGEGGILGVSKGGGIYD